MFKRKAKAIWVGSYVLSAIAEAKGWTNGAMSEIRIDQLIHAVKERKKKGSIPGYEPWEKSKCRLLARSLS